MVRQCKESIKQSNKVDISVWVLCLALFYPFVAIGGALERSDSEKPPTVQLGLEPYQLLKTNLEKNRKGYYLVDLEAYAERDKTRYAAIWQKNIGKISSRRVLKVEMTKKILESYDVSLRKQGYSLLKLGGLSIKGRLRYFAEWQRPQSGRIEPFIAEYEADKNRFELLHRDYVSSGYKLSSLSVLIHNGHPLFSGIWSKGRGQQQIVQHEIPDRKLQEGLDKMRSDGYRLEIIRSYFVPNRNQMFYSAVWKKSSAAPRFVYQSSKAINFHSGQQNAWYSGRLPIGISATVIGNDPHFILICSNKGIPYPKKIEAEELIYNFMQEREIVGLGIAITKDERLVYARGFGYADQAEQLIIDPSHLFRVASVSKALTGTTIMKMVEMGVLSLNDKVFGPNGILGNDYGQARQPPIKNYYLASNIEEMVENPLSLVTVQHLLQHTAGGWPNKGGPSDPIGQEKHLNAAELISWVLTNSDYDLKDKPGMVTAYSNLGYILLGRIIEKTVAENQDLFDLGSDSSYEEIVKKLILEPIGINDMHIGGTRITDKKENEVIYYHTPDDTKTPYGTPFRRKDASGSWIASPVELARFLVHIDRFPKKPDLLSPNTLKAMITADQISDSGWGHGMGWKIMAAKKCKSSDPSDPCRWKKDGSFAGTQALIYRYKKGMNFAIVMNSTPKDIGEDIQDELVFLFNDINHIIGDSWPDYDLF